MLGWVVAVDVSCNVNWVGYLSRILLMLIGVEHRQLHFGRLIEPPDALIQLLAVCPMVFRLWQIVSTDCSSVVDISKKFISSANTNAFRWHISPDLGSWIVHALISWSSSTQFVTSWFTIQLTPLVPPPWPLLKLLPGPPYWVAEVIMPALMLNVVQCRCSDINLESISGTPSRRSITVRLGSQQSNANLQSVSRVAKGVRCWWAMSMLIWFPSTA